MSESGILFWNRLEPNPRSEDIEKALRAEIRDPLWMLSRQWQFGEFQGEDAGFAASISVNHLKAEVSHFYPLNGNRERFDGKSVPLDVPVEKTEYQADIFTRIEIGRHWFRLLKRYLTPSDQSDILQAFRNSDLLQFRLPPQEEKEQQYEHADVFSNEAYQITLAAFEQGNLIDGGLLIDLIADEEVSLSERILGQIDEQVDDLGNNLLGWAGRIYSIKIGKSKSWHSAHLEHQFKVGIPVSEAENIELEAKEFYGGDLDWYQFNYLQGKNIESDSGDTVETGKELLMPSPVRYPGMPSTRWWKLEDNAVNFGNVRPSTTNPASLIFSQFALQYGNDWIMTPLKVDVGAIYQIDKLVVRDNFGISTQIQHQQEVASDENWNFLQMPIDRLDKSQTPFLFLPPGIAKHQKSEAYEKVNFIRDEMANMVWAIEEVIPDLAGGGTNGSKQATALKEYLRGIAENSSEPDQVSDRAKIKYLLEGSVPENWIPFIPVRVPDEDLASRKIQLQRASMPRIIPGFSPQRVRPKTLLLQDGLSDASKHSMFLYEEEVPRSGAIVTGRWKRTRWYNGEIHVWYARQKTNGRGEKSSGLKFDSVHSGNMEK